MRSEKLTKPAWSPEMYNSGFLNSEARTFHGEWDLIFEIRGVKLLVKINAKFDLFGEL